MGLFEQKADTVHHLNSLDKFRFVLGPPAFFRFIGQFISLILCTHTFPDGFFVF